MKCGLTSITFRHLKWEEIIDLASEADLDGIEWGGDIHVPPGEFSLAQTVAQATKEAHLKVFSYGSYYRGTGDFTPVLVTAKALGAPIVRIWAGTKGSNEMAPNERAQLTDNLRKMCAAAHSHNITIGLEYHPDTLTDTAESTIALLDEVGCPNLMTYWQVNPALSFSNNYQDLVKVLPFLCNVHVFQFALDDVQLPLKSGINEWTEYFKLIGTRQQANAILEHVKNHSTIQYHEDAETLLSLIRR